MVLLIIGIVILVAGIVVLIKLYNPVGVLGLVFGLIAIVLAISPISGYEEAVLKQEYELKPVHENSIYIIEDSTGAVTCKHVIPKSHPEAVKAYGTYTYDKYGEIVVTEKGSKPVMKKYIQKARKTIWTIDPKSFITKYIFYVPEENIERWQNEHVN